MSFELQYVTELVQLNLSKNYFIPVDHNLKPAKNFRHSINMNRFPFPQLSTSYGPPAAANHHAQASSFNNPSHYQPNAMIFPTEQSYPTNVNPPVVHHAPNYHFHQPPSFQPTNPTFQAPPVPGPSVSGQTSMTAAQTANTVTHQASEQPQRSFPRSRGRGRGRGRAPRGRGRYNNNWFEAYPPHLLAHAYSQFPSLLQHQANNPQNNSQPKQVPLQETATPVKDSVPKTQTAVAATPTAPAKNLPNASPLARNRRKLKRKQPEKSSVAPSDADEAPKKFRKYLDESDGTIRIVVDEGHSLKHQNDYRYQHRHLTRKHIELENTHAELVQKHEKLEEKIVELEDEYENCFERYGDKKAEIEELNVENEKLEKLWNDEKVKVLRIEDDLKEKTCELEKVRASYDALKKELIEIAGKSDAKTEVIRFLRARLLEKGEKHEKIMHDVQEVFTRFYENQVSEQKEKLFNWRVFYNSLFRYVREYDLGLAFMRHTDSPLKSLSFLQLHYNFISGFFLLNIYYSYENSFIHRSISWMPKKQPLAATMATTLWSTIR